MSKDLGTLEGAKHLVETVVYGGVRENFEKDGYVIPVAFVFARRLPDGTSLDEVGFIPVLGIGATDNEAAKDAFAQTLQKLVRQTNACGIATALESWTHEDTEFYFEQRMKGVPPKEIPGVLEVVHIALEHAAAKSTVMYQAVITRDSSGKGSLGPLALFSKKHPETGQVFVFDGNQKGVHGKGRFDHLLRNANAN